MRNRYIAMLACCSLSAAGCRDGNASSASVRPEPAREAAGDGAEAPDRGEEEASDLDSPVDQLFGRVCEHGKQTFACDECRYEVGVVRVPAPVLEEGLVQTAQLGRRPVAIAVPLTGEVTFDERRVAHLSLPAEGVIRKVHVGAGERVKRGQPLLEVESIGLGEAESELLEARATLRLARKNLDRQAELHDAKITSEREYLEARREHEAARIREEGARAKLHRLGVTAGELERLGRKGAAGAGGRLTLRAPVDGTVLQLHAVAGEQVRPEESLAVIGDLGSLWLLADLYEGDLGKVGPRPEGATATVRVKAFPDRTFRGTVELVGATMDETTRTVKVRIAIPNPDGLLRPGMFARVELWQPGAEEVLAAPEDAVLADEGRSFVFVHHHDDYYVRRPVEVGRRFGGWVELRSGPAGGETVVTNGSFLLKSDVLRSKMGAGCAD
jgi:cobalt-zinc-cadmium efflux system membrane fusion protein